MPNTSATGGYLQPAATPAPAEGSSFEDFLQAVLVGLSGLSPKLVRPDWQPEPPNQPDRGRNWVAFGVMLQTPDTYAYIGHNSEGEGSDELFRQEDVEVLLSAYGPDSQGVMAKISDGFQVEQNLAVLSSVAIGFTNTGPITAAPVLDKAQWLRRFDMLWKFKRAIRREYPVLNILSAPGVIYAESMSGDRLITTPFLVTES